MYMIAVGDIVDGMSFIGPFEDCEGANEYAECVYRNETWWVIDLVSPVELPEE